MKRTITINDTLQETVDHCIEELKDKLIEYWQDNLDKEEICLSNDIDYDGSFHELIDSNVPIYNSEINDLFYLYGDELEQAYDDAGLYDEKPDNYKQVCIYCYLEQEVANWFNENIEGWQDDINDCRDTLEESQARSNLTEEGMNEQLKICIEETIRG